MLSELVASLPVRSRRGADDVLIRAATADSREVREGSLFAAIPGSMTDGHEYIEAALAAGASVVLLQRWPEQGWPPSVAGIEVPDPRRALALASRVLEGEPAAEMTVFAVTGTNGKTSTVSILRSILAAAGRRSGSIGTTGISWDSDQGERCFTATHTTPEGPALYRWLRRMKADGVDSVALELSSHALDQGRAAGLPLDVAAWSNLSRDHLDYHGDMRRYEAAKARLLTEWLPTWGAPGARAVLNVDDLAVSRHIGTWRDVLTVSCQVGAAAVGVDVAPADAPELGLHGIRARIDSPVGPIRLHSALVGEHNLANLLLAGACALAAGIPSEALEEGWRLAKGAPGRLERVQRVDGAGPLVLVDYAHSEQALRAALAALRPYVPGELICVFGCGGDRDPGKRPKMAAAAAEGADLVYLTSDNPRSEDPAAIIKEAAAGLPTDARCAVEVDRAAAIAAAIAAAGAGDLVLIAGKGHEAYQEIAGRRLPFDDREQARAALDAWA